jgi:hypothetical protein
MEQLLSENRRVVQLVSKSPAFYGTRSSITTFTKARHWTVTRMQSTPS